MLKGYFLCTYSVIELAINLSFVQQTSNKLLLYKAHLICLYIVKWGKKNREMYLEVGTMKLTIIKECFGYLLFVPPVPLSTILTLHLALGGSSIWDEFPASIWVWPMGRHQRAWRIWDGVFIFPHSSFFLSSFSYTSLLKVTVPLCGSLL